ncbi:NAD+ diphosphatase [Chitinivorax tropicus]|uniref:NAD(+) diphosphatase n=1 Tax=Chitinivorax tropicus TaxID=714531 RepID=A0A840MJ96_9PROT|nr:NAD(+) diphosphatase [Chitinivorax tropicus]MBB5017259.1 NAD+ diphosphatase [Chitinivorax tropicus]
MQRFELGFDRQEDIPPHAIIFAFHQNKIVLSADQPLDGVQWAASQLMHQAGSVHWIGRADDRRPCIALRVEAETLPEHLCTIGLRAALLNWSPAMIEAVSRAAQLLEWDRTHRFCGVCGAATQPKGSEHAKQCPGCGHVAYPRLSPAIMVLIRRGREVLLARSPGFTPGAYSALAGFVEPGESLEAAVHREVKEEVGVSVTNLRYFGSQSWPFPHSMMIAFVADYAGGELAPDGVEIEDAGFYPPESLPGLPYKLSIARHLIESVIGECSALPT